jgi:hypothetical protein
MTEEHGNKKHVPWILWPFWALWKLVVGIVAGTGRLVAVILGLVFLIVGVVLTVTIIGGIVINGEGVVLKKTTFNPSHSGRSVPNLHFRTPQAMNVPIRARSRVCKPSAGRKVPKADHQARALSH